MKNNILLLTVLGIFSAFTASSQVLIDKAIQLTGSGANAMISGIQTVTDSSNAVNVKVIQNNSLVYAADTSNNTNAYAVPFAPALSSYTVGMVVYFKANFANTDSVTTLSVSGLPAAPIKKNYNSDLAANDIQSGQMVIVMYDGTNWQMLSQLGNASSGNSSGDPTLTYTTNGF